jgi:chromate transporter
MVSTIHIQKRGVMVSLVQLAATFLKIGTFGFGGPFSLLAIMQKQVVERHKWLTAEDFAQSVAIGTMTPGPIFFSTAVFIGYRLRGILGAAVSGLGILLPSFSLVVIIAALYIQMQQTPWVVAVSRGIAAGVVGLFVSVVFKMGRSIVTDKRSVLLVVAAFLLLAFLRIDPIALIIIAGIGGACFFQPVAMKKARQG